MADELAEFARAVGADAGDDRDHAFLAQVGAQVMIVVVVSGDAHRLIDRSDAAAAGDARRAVALILGEQVRHADAESLAELLQLVITQRQPVMLDLRQR